MKAPEILEILIKMLLWCIGIGGSVALLLALYISYRLNPDSFKEIFKSGYYVPICPLCGSQDIDRNNLKRPKREIEICRTCGYIANREEFENEAFK